MAAQWLSMGWSRNLATRLTNFRSNKGINIYLKGTGAEKRALSTSANGCRGLLKVEASCLRLCKSATRITFGVESNGRLRHSQFHTTSRCRAEEERIVMVPPFAESVSEGDVRWEKAVGDSVKEDDVVAEIETDKTSIPIPAPFAGVIEERFAEDGATVQPGLKLFRIRRGEGGAPSQKSESKPAAAPTPAQPAAPPPPSPKSSSSAGPIPSAPPSPPSVPRTPVTSIPVSSVKPAVATPPKGVDPTTTITGTRTEQRVKMNRMRQRIAQRLKDAQNTNAMLTTFNEIDMSNIMEMRKKHQEAFQKKHNIKLGFMSAFVKASAYALQDQPVVNAVIDGQDIIYRDYVDISVAVATPKGLVVPVLRNVESQNFAEIEQGMVALGEKARSGALAIEDMDGGTFTISNGGVFGSMFGTPIINPPQSAILGMHGIFERPVAIAGKVEIRPMMYVALTYDHRLVDGREAVTFLRKVKAVVEDPRIILLDI
ncbi:hypothetical protein CHUAL_004331 [Chamberlinius hualienensis]